MDPPPANPPHCGGWNRLTQFIYIYLFLFIFIYFVLFFVGILCIPLYFLYFTVFTVLFCILCIVLYSLFCTVFTALHCIHCKKKYYMLKKKSFRNNYAHLVPANAYFDVHVTLISRSVR